MIYLVDAGKSQIMKMTLQGEELAPIAVPSDYVENCEGIAVDWVGKYESQATG